MQHFLGDLQLSNQPFLSPQRSLLIVKSRQQMIWKALKYIATYLITKISKLYNSQRKVVRVGSRNLIFGFQLGIFLIALLQLL
jgi:hypothetical protein